MSKRDVSGVPRAAVIGVGGFGFHHVNALSLLADEGLCHLVAGCDLHIDSFKDAPGEPPGKLQLFKTCEDMLRAGKFDYIVIASPPHLHYEHAIQALDHGAFVYLEKPPVPTIAQLDKLLEHPGSNKIAVGFHILGATVLRALKGKLCAGELGELMEVSASGLWPRSTAYYERATWAGKMHLSDQTVFDGPLTNALAHIVQNVFFLAGKKESSFALPKTVRGFYARARYIDSYDFAWIKGLTEDGIPFNILAGHCTDTAIAWKVSVHAEKGIFSIKETDVPRTEELLLESHRSALAAQQGSGRVTTGLSDCLGYNMATSAGLISSSGIHPIPPEEIKISGIGAGTTYHVERIYRLVENGQKESAFLAEDAGWIKFGKEINCQEALARNSHSLK
jgi:predicted dehydrogenase